jgi:hypothetical protein
MVIGISILRRAAYMPYRIACHVTTACRVEGTISGPGAQRNRVRILICGWERMRLRTARSKSPHRGTAAAVLKVGGLRTIVTSAGPHDGHARGVGEAQGTAPGAKGSARCNSAADGRPSPSCGAGYPRFRTSAADRNRLRTAGITAARNRSGSPRSTETVRPV